MKAGPHLIADLLCAAALLALLGAAVGVWVLDLGRWDLPLALGVAGTKVILIAAVFMDLREGPSLIRLVAIAGIYWGGILFALTLADILMR